MILNEYYTLTNGVKIPKLGLGTWFIDNDKVAEAVKEAVRLGYRHIDTTQGYGNEQGVGLGVRSCGVPREKLFITTKLEASRKSYAESKAGIEQSLKALGLEYIDLMIIHSPQPWTDFRGEQHFYKENLEVWKALEEAYHQGKLRAIGVSNFEKNDLENILQHATVKPMVNQILTHIGNTPFELIDFMQEQNILTEAYSPVAHGAILENNELMQIANKYNVTVPQLCIRYCIQLNLIALPKTANPKHMKENGTIDFVISEEDMKTLQNMETLDDYGEANMFPVYGGKLQADGTYNAK